MSRWLLPVLLLAACSAAPGPNPADAGARLEDAAPAADATAPEDATPAEDSGPSGCGVVETVTASQAAAGRASLIDTGLGGRFAPRLALENLWLVWGGGAPRDFWAAFRARYGFAEAPEDAQDRTLPAGLKDDGQGWVTADCLVCHAGTVAGRTIVGAANNRADLALLVDDLTTLARQFGAQVPSPVRIRTGARGVSDIVGMTMQLSLAYAPPGTQVNTEVGYQDPPAWWALRQKSRIYVDGSGSAATHRSMMATLLAFGLTLPEISAREPEFVAIRAYLMSLPTPRWPFAEPDPARVARGQLVFRQTCARCHGDDRCARVDPRIVPRDEIGTDPERSIKYGAAEIGLLNASWFGQDEPHRVTEGYVAPALRGLWASAPYFHNGSAPTVADVLDSQNRPRFFRVRGTGEAEYDPDRLGLRVDVLEAVPANSPRAERSAVYDTTQVGLGNGGHTFGDALGDEERADLLEFLKTQ